MVGFGVILGALVARREGGDLIPGSRSSQRQQIIDEFKGALDETGTVVR